MGRGRGNCESVERKRREKKEKKEGRGGSERREEEGKGRKGACRTAVEFPGMKIILECPDGGVSVNSPIHRIRATRFLRPCPIESFRRGSFVSGCTFKTTRWNGPRELKDEEEREEKEEGKTEKEIERDPLPHRSTLVKILSLFDLASGDEGDEKG